jgi:hypothetical protein
MLTTPARPNIHINLNSGKVLEQDVGLITTQEDHFKRTGGALIDDYLLMSCSDTFVKAYRQWLDKVGHGMPWFQGLAKRSSNVDAHVANIPPSPPNLDPLHHRAGNQLETCYHRHVIHCPSTRRALGRVQALKRIAIASTLASVTVSCFMAASYQLLSHKGTQELLKFLVPLITLWSLAAASLLRLEQCFFVSFRGKIR